MLGTMILLLVPFIIFIKKFVFSTINHLIIKYNPAYLTVVKKHHFFLYLFHNLLCLYVIFWNNLFNTVRTPFTLLFNDIKSVCITVYTTFSITMLLIAIINTTTDIYKTKAIARHIPIALHTQIVKIFIIVFAVIIGISFILNISLSTFFTSLGAAAALLTFIFKDTVLALLASLQLTFQDIIRIGDWINVPQYNIDGNVETITISIVKIRNFDKTISTIPTYNLLTSSIKNWRGMMESGGRRIKRVIYIDMNNIIFCSEQLLEHLKKLPYIANAITEKLNSNKPGHKLTNIEIFRLYISEYLKNNELIHQEDFTFLVRELEITSAGLPLEIYIFTKEMDLIKYENIQSDIFDHLIAIMPEFELRPCSPA